MKKAAVPGYSENKQKVLARLRRIEGQVRGITKMVEQDRYCIDVLTQVAAAKAALEGVSVNLLEDHMHHCVADAIKAGDGTAKVREVSEAIERLVRS
jgi:CsoR family transcriptional regulator, copper-sensing transcriptional repressor